MLFSSYMDSDNATHYKKRSDVIDSPSDLSDLSETPSSSEPEPPIEKSNEQALPPLERRNKRLFIIGAIIAGVIAVVVIGFFLTQRKEISGPGQTPEPTSTSTPTPTETPKPIFDRSEWSLEVLNGSGVTGAAKKLADKLESLGYKILKTGNADKSDYEKTELFVAKDMQDKQDLLLEDLKKEIDIASVSGELRDSTASGRIIIGKE